MNDNGSCYFWREEKIIEVPEFIYADTEVSRAMLNCYCLDTHIDDLKGKYGMFIPRNTGITNLGTWWEHRPYEEFPQEFKTRLLLLGVG